LKTLRGALTGRIAIMTYSFFAPIALTGSGRCSTILVLTAGLREDVAITANYKQQEQWPTSTNMHITAP
jgi:hypothetical protein